MARNGETDYRKLFGEKEINHRYMKYHYNTYYDKKIKPPKTVFQYLKLFFEQLNSHEKIASITSALATWFIGGIMLFDAPIWLYLIKGIMWLGTVAVGAVIPKIATQFYDLKLKHRIFKIKKRKNGKQKDDNEAAA